MVISTTPQEATKFLLRSFNLFFGQDENASPIHLIATENINCILPANDDFLEAQELARAEIFSTSVAQSLTVNLEGEMRNTRIPH